MPEILKRPEARLRKLRLVFIEPEPKPEPAPSSVLDAIKIVLKESYGTTLESISLRTRKQNITYLRYVVAILLYENDRKSHARIGMILGNRDHATMLNAKRNISKAREGFNYELLEMLNYFTNQLKQMGVI